MNVLGTFGNPLEMCDGNAWSPLARILDSGSEWGGD